MALGGIIASAVKGAAKQGIEIADQAIIDEQKMKELLETGRQEKERIDYQAMIDLKAYKERDKLTDENVQDERRYQEGRYDVKRGHKLSDAKTKREQELADADTAYQRQRGLVEMQQKPQVVTDPSTGGMFAADPRTRTVSPFMRESTVTDTVAGTKPNEPSSTVSRTERKPFSVGTATEWKITEERGFPEMVNVKTGDRKNAPKPPGTGWKFKADDYGGGVWSNDQKGEVWRVTPEGQLEKLPNPGETSGIPREAIKDLLSDPSTEARREFDAIFGDGAAARALGDQAGGKKEPPPKEPPAPAAQPSAPETRMASERKTREQPLALRSQAGKEAAAEKAKSFSLGGHIYDKQREYAQRLERAQQEALQVVANLDSKEAVQQWKKANLTKIPPEIYAEVMRALLQRERELKGASSGGERGLIDRALAPGSRTSERSL